MRECTFEFRVELNQTPKRKPMGRSKSGCLCCRKRKVKCDELKPICSYCQKRGFVCEWPQNGEQSLSRHASFKPSRIIGYELSDSKKTEKGFRKFKFDVKNSTNLKTKTVSSSISSLLLENTPVNSINTSSLICKHQSPPKIEEITNTTKKVNSTIIEFDEPGDDLWYRNFIRKLSLSSGPSHILTGHQTWLIGIDMTQEEAYCYDAYLKGFMVATSPQHTHIKLQPATIVIPYVSDNPAVRSVMYACGAFFLSHSDEKMISVAIKNLENCLNLILLMLNMNLISGSEEFLMIVAMTLVVKEKFFETSTETHLVQLKLFYYLIKQWWFKKTKHDAYRNELPLESFDSNNITSVLEDKVRNGSNYSPLSEKILQLYKKVCQRTIPVIISVANIDEPITTKYMDLSSNFAELSYLDSSKRLMVDSFLYNYSVSWLTCDKSNLYLLESPFQVFEEFKPLLQGDIYKCPVHWMNYPVSGAGLPAIELLAKTSWLSLQVPLVDYNKLVAKKLLKYAKFYVSPVIPIDVFSCSKVIQNKLRESCYLGELNIIACEIFLTKLVYPDIKTNDKEIQDYVKEYILALEKLTPYCAGSVNGLWAFVVAGSAMIETDHRNYLMERLHNFNKALQMECISSIKDYLTTIWDGPGLGLDGLFERDLLKKLYI